VEQVRQQPEIERLGYFGSYARGDWGVGSDLDLVAVVDDSREPFERRSLNWDLHGLPVPADILIYTALEWEELQGRDDKFSRMLSREVVWTYLRNS
jgi:predicted nucleotidyltransferase